MKNTMMKKFFVGLFSLLMGVGSAFAQTNMSSEMYDLAKMKEGLRNRRVSSYDRTGNNRDHLKAIKPGETAVLADIKGAGVINHIWITMSPGPRQLSRNDIILRMYWDGSDEPSVVSPIGPFFGQGWNEQYNYASFALSSGPNGGTGLCSYFAMPFAKGARIEIENQTDVNIGAFYYYIDYVEMKELPKDMGRFHAWFNREITEALPEGETEWGSVGMQVKQAVTGYGKAVKKQVQEMTRVLLHLPAVPKPDDTADALAMAITFCHTNGNQLNRFVRRVAGPI